MHTFSTADMSACMAHGVSFPSNQVRSQEDEVVYKCVGLLRTAKSLLLLISITGVCINTLRPIQNGSHLANNISKCIFMNENVGISITILLRFDPKGPINNIPALVQMMAWCRPGNNPLSESMMVRLPSMMVRLPSMMVRLASMS